MPSAAQLVDLLAIATRALNLAVRPTVSEQKLFAGFLGREKGVQFAQLDHAEKYSDSGGFCQVPDNSP
jgi:hypothetical protein